MKPITPVPPWETIEQIRKDQFDARHVQLLDLERMMKRAQRDWTDLENCLPAIVAGAEKARGRTKAVARNVRIYPHQALVLAEFLNLPPRGLARLHRKGRKLSPLARCLSPAYKPWLLKWAAQVLGEERRSLKVTQAKLAQLTGIKRVVISQLENGRFDPARAVWESRIRRIEKALLNISQSLRVKPV